MSGRTARQNTRAGQSRSSDPLIRGGNVAAFEPDDVVIHLLGKLDTGTHGAKGMATVDLTPALTELDYGADIDSLGAINGTVTLQRSDPQDPATLKIDGGNLISLGVTYKGGEYSGFDMRASSPSIALPDGSVSLDLVDPFAPLMMIYDRWSYRASKAKKKGWFAHEVVADALRRSGVPFGSLMRGTKRFQRLEKKSASLLELIIAAYAREYTLSGRLGSPRMRHGVFEYVAQSRNRIAYVIDGSSTTDVTVSVEQSNVPFTVVVAKGFSGKGTRRRKYKRTVLDPRGVARYGYVPQTMDYQRVDGLTELLEHARRDLATSLRVVRTAEVDCAYLPFINFGDAVVLDAGIDQDFGGVDRVGFVYGYHHTLSGTSRRTTLSLKEQDDYIKYREIVEKKARDAARKKRSK